MNKLSFKFVKTVAINIAGKPTIYGKENIIEGETGIFMANHQRMYGPIAAVCKFPVPVRAWANSQIMDKKECKKYLEEVSFIKNLGYSRRKAKLLATLLYRLSSDITRSANPIPAYWDIKRMRKSISLGVQAFENGESQIIFAKSTKGNKGGLPENFDFLKGYLIVLKEILDRGYDIPIYPVSMNSKEKYMSIGKAIYPNRDIKWEIARKNLNKLLVEKVVLGYSNPEEMIK